MKESHFYLNTALFIAFLCNCIQSFGANLFENGKTQYSIVIDKSASISEKTAADELSYYLNKVSKAKFGITNNTIKTGLNIFIGYNKRVEKDLGINQPKDNDEGFTYLTKNNNIYIFGGKGRGTMYGVYSFLENELRIKWLTSDCTIIPSYKKWRVKDLKHHEEPAFQYRFDEFYHFFNDTALYVHNKMNMQWEALPNKYGRQEPYCGVHTSFFFIPPSKYFKQHPEYFSLRNGKRIDNGQLCLSNPDVLKIIIKGFKEKRFNDVIGYWAYDVSQNDNELYCQCKNCKVLEKKYGGHSGIWIWFVNQIAKEYPKYKIGTLAYRYTQVPPKNIVPLQNVVIRLCPINCCYAHPIDECPKNKSFLDDLRGWSNLTNNLYIYDYVVDFNQFLLPWPNFQVLGPNMKTFKSFHAIALHECGQYKSGDGEFSEMKAWVISKLLWNPELNTDSLVRVFINGYYGNAADEVYSYYKECQKIIIPSTHLTTMTRWDDAIYSDDFIQKSKAILTKAENKVNNSIIKKRVERVALQVYYLEMMRNKSNAILNGSYKRALRIIQRDKPYINEGISGDEFLEKNKYI